MESDMLLALPTAEVSLVPPDWEIIKALRRARGADGRQGFSQRRLASWPRMF